MIHIGVICPSEIAFRRFMPALAECKDKFNFIGIAVASADEWGGDSEPATSVLEIEKQKAAKFIETYGGKLFESYKELIHSPEIDAVYLPLPPALHYKWGKEVLQSGKHLFMEKPFTTSLVDSNELIELASAKNLAIHENYMFIYHSQIDYIKKMIADGALGTLRLIRIDFGFPFRGANDFRYNKALGGGALIDCGGYTIRLATELLGESVSLVHSSLTMSEEYGVDIAGSATLVNESGFTAQISFGMDNAYRCSLDLWGSEKSLYTNRILTAPVGYKPEIVIRDNSGERKISLEADDTFRKSLLRFEEKVNSPEERSKDVLAIKKQAELVEKFMRENKTS